MELKVVNAYITFRSMEGKDRAVQAYNISMLPRKFVELFCCMSVFFKKRKILKKSYPYVEAAHDPATIIWENLNVSMARTLLVYVIELMVAALLLLITFIGMAYFGYAEKVRIDYVKSKCIGMQGLTAQ